MGKVDSGVVSVTSLYADERLYYPLEVEPYTPAHWFDKGKNDPAFQTKPQIALELVEREVAAGMPFKAVVADSFYGENDAFRIGLTQRESGPIGFVLALNRSHCWWHREGQIGCLLEAAQQAGWQDPQQPGQWERVERPFADGHTEVWWALEVKVGPYGREGGTRAVVATTDPALLPEANTWFLATNLPRPDGQSTASSCLPCADLAEVIRLYGLRNWVEQSYKQVKQSLGWAQYQVRSDAAMRRHWALVMCAFTFVWCSLAPPSDPLKRAQAPPGDTTPPPEETPIEGRGENQNLLGAASLRLAHLLATGSAGSTLLAGALATAGTYLEGVERSATA